MPFQPLQPQREQGEFLASPPDFEEVQKTGFLKKAGSALIKSEKGFAESLAAALFSGKAKKQEEQETQENLALLDSVQTKLKDPNVSTAQKYRLLQMAQNLGQSTISEIDTYQKTAKQVVGEGVGVATDILGFGSIAGQVPKVFGSKALQAGLIGATEGAIFGGLQGGSMAAQENKDVGEISAQAGKSLLTGAALGGAIGVALSGAGSVFEKYKQKGINSVEDVFSEADDTFSAASLRSKAELEAPKLRLKEKYVGLQPDIKKRLQKAGPGLTSEYVDVAMARNLDDTIPTPLEYAANYAEDARNQMLKTLEDTGNEIGQFRAKVSSVKIPNELADQTLGVFDDEISKLNLTTRNGIIQQTPGRVSKASSAEINTLQTLRDNLRILKQAPTVNNVIENRVAFDDLINFKKSQREVSGIVDPLSRKMRSKLADINRQVIGKSEAKNLQKYTDYLSALTELNSYIDRRAGSELLLKRVLSERGKDARKLMDVVSEYTGIDLLDHATLASIVTDFLGNQRQKGLFEQQVTNAGLDVAAFLRGDKLGAALSFMKTAVDKAIDTETVIKKAAR